MEKLLIVIAAISLVVVAALFVLGYLSHSGAAQGLVEGRLQPCPDTPNCVSSEFASDADHYVEPLLYPDDDAAKVLTRLKQTIGEMGGNIQVAKSDYLAATFTSRIFRFVDDLEVRIDSAGNTIHLRSASRVGLRDGGVNRNRVELLKKRFREQYS